MVIVSHQHALLGLAEPTPMPFTTWGTIGVYIFFSLSGFLVAKSWQDDPHVWRFVARRGLRIWPGLLMATLLSVFLIGPVFTTYPVHEYFASPSTWRYFGNTVLVVQFQLPGVFDSNPGGHAVNGSLWTIPVEVYWYGLLVVAGAVGLFRRRWLVLASCVGVFTLTFLYLDVKDPVSRAWKLELGCFFLAGALLFIFRDLWHAHRVRIVAVLTVAAAVVLLLGQAYMAVVFVLPFAVIAVGSASFPVLHRAGRWGDPSYGLYIYAFPVQQCVAAVWGKQLGFFPALVLSCALTTVVAYASWHSLEKPALGLKRRLKRKVVQPSPVHA